jgi:hypothetical protein
MPRFDIAKNIFGVRGTLTRRYRGIRVLDNYRLVFDEVEKRRSRRKTLEADVHKVQRATHKTWTFCRTTTISISIA